MRTLQCSESGQPPPKRFEPQTRQNVFALPSGGWYVCTRSSPSTMRIAPDGARTFAVLPPPESFLHDSQWQKRMPSGVVSTSNLTPPQRQVPWSVVIAGAVPTLPRLYSHPDRGT